MTRLINSQAGLLHVAAMQQRTILTTILMEVALHSRRPEGCCTQVSPPGAVPDKASSPAAGPMDKLQTPPAINGTTAKALAN